MNRRFVIGIALAMGMCGCKTVQDPSINDNIENTNGEAQMLQPVESAGQPDDSQGDAAGDSQGDAAKADASESAGAQADDSEEDSGPKMIEAPVDGWAWEKLTEFCSYPVREATYDDAEYMLNQDGDWGQECSDGKKYCYGMDNMPILKPDSEGWSCRYVAKMPSKYYKPNSYEYYVWRKGAWYYDDIHRVRQLYAKWAYLKTWLCEYEEGCECGKHKCPQNAACIDGSCFCNDKSIASGGKCTLEMVKSRNIDDQDTIKQWKSLKGLKLDEDNQNIYYTSKKTNKEGEDEYYCGKYLLTDHDVQHCVTLSDGKIAVYFEPSELRDRLSSGAYGENDKYLMDLEAEKKYCIELCEEFDCSGEEDGLCVDGHLWRRDIDAEREGNKENTSYACGKETCVKEEICLNDHCVGLGTHKKLPKGYTWRAYMPSCNDMSGCACGSNQCTFGQYCIENQCMNTPFVQKYRGKLVHYGMAFGISSPEYYKNLSAPKDDVWFDILTDSDSIACDNATMPAKIDEYKCVYERIMDDRLESPQEIVTAKGYYCAQDKGCSCGSESCPKHARCLQGKCVYDGIYMTLACHYDSDMIRSVQDVNSVLHYLDERGWCHCGASFVPPNMPGYQCVSGGMHCTLEEGCACGDVTCAKDQACLKPGECR